MEFVHHYLENASNKSCLVNALFLYSHGLIFFQNYIVLLSINPKTKSIYGAIKKDVT